MTSPPENPDDMSGDPTSPGPSPETNPAADGTDTRTAPTPDDGPRVRWEEARDLGRLRRTRERKVAGVAGGLARHLDIDPLIVRIGFVVLVFFGGAGLILYAAGWLFVPAEDTGRANVRLDARTRSVVLVVAVGVAALAVLGDTAGAVGIPWPVVVLGLLAVLVIASRRSTGDETPSPASADLEASPEWHVPGTIPRPAAYAPDAAPRPRPYRGPVLFWFALAVLALTLGLLAVADGAGLSVAGGAYPALALAIIGALLVLGSVWGRPGGLVALGLLAAVATGIAAAGATIEADTNRVMPATAAELDGSYGLAAGELVVDLRDVEDLDALDGRTLELDARFGRLEVIVPAGLDVTGRTRVDNLGEVDAFGERSNLGGPISADGGIDAPTLRIDAEVGFGEIVLEQTGGITR